MTASLTNRALEWAERISAAWARSAESILETGRLLAEAKEQLAHGEWLPMLEHVGFERRKAQRLMEIASDKRFANAAILTLLPDEWTSVHALHKIDCDIPQLIEYIEKPHLIKQEKRAAKEFLLGAKQRALPDEKFGVIVSDPEWHDEVWSEQTGMDRHASNHYPTSAADVIASRPVASIAADDSSLWLWVTNQHLAIGLDVMKAWGFEYKSNYCWGKDRISLGRWNRGKHELCLIGIKGRPPCPAPGTQWDSLILAPKGKHSAKPEIFLEMIEQYFPTLPKIELNRRGPARPGWGAWGNEAEQTTEHDAAKPSDVASSEPAPHPSPQTPGAGSPLSDTRAA